MAERESGGSDPVSGGDEQSKSSRKAKGIKKSDPKRELQEDIDRVSVIDTDVPECAVCLQSCVQAVQLPCGHIFCFLCVKGVANQSKRCALCRNEIPMEFLNCPNLVKPVERIPPAPEDIKEGYTWFYEGRNGWWQYDERTTIELEEAYKQKNRCIELLIAGFLYVIDFENMIQIRRNDPTRRRRIKRDLSSVPMKGVAGIKYLSSVTQDQRQGDGGELQKTDTAAVSKATSSSAGDQDVQSTAAQLSAITISDQNDNEDGGADGEAASPNERMVSSACSSSRDQTSVHSERTNHQSRYKSPNSLASMSSQALVEGVQNAFPQGLRLRRGTRRQNRNVDSPVSREEYLSGQSENRSGRRYVPRSVDDTAVQSRYDGDVDSSDDDD